MRRAAEHVDCANTGYQTADSPATHGVVIGGHAVGGVVIPFPRPQRAWRITEKQVELYVVELHEVDRGVIFSTAPAKFTRVLRFLRRARNGWPVWLKDQHGKDVRL
jgi:hypothetical protein